MSKEELLKYLIAEIDLIMHDKDYRFENANGTWYSRESCRDLTNEEVFEELRTELRQFADLEAKLAESEKSKESYRLQNEHHHLQLLQFYSRLGVEAFGADIHEKALETLMIMKEQLAEKEKEISEYIKIVDDLHKQLSDKCDFCDKTKDQDKISFAVDILEELAGCSNYINSKLDFECGSYVSEKAIRDKIKYLKGKKDE